MPNNTRTGLKISGHRSYRVSLNNYLLSLFYLEEFRREVNRDMSTCGAQKTLRYIGVHLDMIYASSKA